METLSFKYIRKFRARSGVIWETFFRDEIIYLEIEVSDISENSVPFHNLISFGIRPVTQPDQVVQTLGFSMKFPNTIYVIIDGPKGICSLQLKEEAWSYPKILRPLDFRDDWPFRLVIMMDNKNLSFLVKYKKPHSSLYQLSRSVVRKGLATGLIEKMTNR